MSKFIKIPAEHIEDIRKEFDEALLSGKFADGKISFTKTLSSSNRKAKVFFTELAWLKMQTLIREFDKEVAWHGIAKRGDDTTKDEYFITDILVYPQEVTGATVNTDQEKYQMWLMNHEDDVFNNIRMQGHSHVNMSTKPSSVDTSLYERILEQLDDSMFYIFMIWNKKKEKTIKIYDLEKNVLFETSDIIVEVLDDIGFEKFLKDAKEMVKEKPAIHYYNNSSYKGYSSYNYNNGNYGTSKKEEPKSTTSFTSTQNPCKQKKGRRKGKNKKVKNSILVSDACNEQEQLTFLCSDYGNESDDKSIIDPLYSDKHIK